MIRSTNFLDELREMATDADRYHGPGARAIRKAINHIEMLQGMVQHAEEANGKLYLNSVELKVLRGVLGPLIYGAQHDPQSWLEYMETRDWDKLQEFCRKFPEET